MTARLASLALLAVVASACGSSSSGGQQPPPPPPPPKYDLPVPAYVVATTSAFGTFQLTWTNPPGGWERCDIEVRVGSGAFVPATSCGAGATSATVRVDGAPELETVAFRVRTVLGASTSDWSDIATARQLLLPVSGLTASSATGADGQSAPPITVRWTSPSSWATELQVERTTEDIFGAPGVLGPWRPIAADPSREWVADAPADGAFYHYRVRRGTLGIWSTWAETRLAYPLLAPADLRIEAVADDAGMPNALRLGWTNRSDTATEISVLRETGVFFGLESIATLSADATWYVERFPVWSSWVYALEVRRGYWWTRTAIVRPSFLIPGEPPVEARSIDLPCNRWVIRDGAGRWVCTLDDRVVYRMTDTGAWDRHDFPAVSANVFVDVDAANAPHALHTPLLSQGARHAWHDGTAWQEEDVPLPPPDPTDPYAPLPRVLGFGVTSAGAPVVLVQTGYGSAPTFTVLTRGEAGWFERPIFTRPDIFYFDFQMSAVGPDGTAVLFGALGTPNVCAAAILRPGDAEAQLEPIPGTDGLCFGGFWAALLGAGAGRAAIGYGFPRETGDTDWFYREWTPAGWGDPELVTTQPLSRRLVKPGGIFSRDGSRATLFLSWPNYRYEDPQTLKVFARGRFGGWRELTLGPGFPMNAWMHGGGFLADGRMWVLGLTDAPFQPTIRYALYEEQ